MHPEIGRAQFGHCPICGMALEPREPGGNDEGNAELADMTRRFWTAVALTVPVLALVMSDYLPGLQSRVPHGVPQWLELALSSPVVLWAGWPFFVRGWNSVVRRNLNMFTLIALGV